MLLGSRRRRRKPERAEEAANQAPHLAPPVPAFAAASEAEPPVKRGGRFTPRRAEAAAPVAAAPAARAPAAPSPAPPSPARAPAAPAPAARAPAARAPAARAPSARAPAARAPAARAPAARAPAARAPAARAPTARRAPTPPPRAPAPPPPELFAPRVAWPSGADQAWRCEITWRSGYRRSEFRALATGPGGRRKTVVAASSPFKNLVKDPATVPRPELASAVRDLMIALEAQGWTPVAPGGRWYSRRFVWTNEGPPPGVEGVA